ncbi:hypothetical protein [Nostoc sp. FACHB-110]|uniref:hypothetical protein n=1 Tax=Nostoc sp. FACHB-110 TaxID=2692834 RepID=UPI001684499C|nr:hypothetical protein [Nostoc sp. FACHB-110]MBD2438258.1 hypothetical protein [Nostoc sp. FACHB-110]
MACENKSKAIVIWQWQGEQEKNFETKQTPVDVTLTPITNSDNPYWNVKNQAGETIFTFQSHSYNLFANTTYERQPKAGDYLIELVNASNQITSQFVYDFPVSISLANITGCKIEIKNGNTLLFSEQRNNKPCPVYKIRCENDCASDEIKCECNHYPGYCCVPCNHVKSKIAQATATLKQVKA